MDRKCVVPELLKVVHITWIDSKVLGEWDVVTELTHEMEVIHTVGFLVHQDETSYLIASSYDKETESINAAIWIPRACVQTLSPLANLKI